jgi:DNA-binding beta-propeller fold protein YncE
LIGPDETTMATRRSMLLWMAGSVLAPGLSGCGMEGGDDRPELIWGVHGTSGGWLHKPRAAAFDVDDQLYLADLTDRIQVFDRDGHFLRSWRMPALNVDGPSGVNVDRLGRVLVADTHFYRVMIYTRQGKLIEQVGDGVQGSSPGRFVYATDAVIDKKGNLIVCEYGDFDRIQVFSPEGDFLRQWGGHGYDPGQFLRPRGLVIDDAEVLYVADSCNHRIQVFDTGGKLLGMWGSRGLKPGQMSFPYDISLGPDGFLYVCEYGNSRVQKFTKEGRSVGLWGHPGRDPGGLDNPCALAVDSLGAVSVVDSGNHRVQRFYL